MEEEKNDEVSSLKDLPQNLKQIKSKNTDRSQGEKSSNKPNLF